jgi:hypothetical protein
MMEDKKAAKPFLSAIIEEEVLDIDDATQKRTFRRSLNNPTEKEEEEKLFLSVCRFNFYAKIQVSDGGFKTVTIELQKAKFPWDVMRFRYYPGSHYLHPINTYDSKRNKNACCFYRIFLLGQDIGIPDCPIVCVDYKFKNGKTEECLDATNEFLRSLDSRSWIIQLEQLKQYCRNDVEKLLSIFNQENWTSNQHILNVNEDEFPEKYHPIIRRLHIASQKADIQKAMEQEDDFMQELLSVKI